MSTSYFRLKKPVSHLELREAADGYLLTVWVDGKYTGILHLPPEHLKSVVGMFTQYEGDFDCPLRTHWGGPERGTIVTVNDDTLADELVVISEYGDLLTVGQVMARSGARRKDGMPTELFGYEDWPKGA